MMIDYSISKIENRKDNCQPYIYMLKLHEGHINGLNVQMMNGQNLM